MCEICGRSSCAPWMHSIEAQEQYERQKQTHSNGAPMFNDDGMRLDDQGNRSIFDDVDQ